MRGLHELYDSLEGIRGAFEARNPIVWVARQQWLRTLLAETGSDDHLPNTRLLSDLAFPEGASEMTALRALLPNCRQEILALLEVEANDARAALSSRSKGSAVRAS